MTYIVTGGCGFVGSNVVAHLLSAGTNVIACDNLSRHGAEANLNWLRGLGLMAFYQVDVRNPEDLDRIIERYRPTAVFHLAGQVAMTTSMNDPRRDFETNVVGTFNLLEAVRRFSPSTAIVYASSNKVYGNLSTVPITEDALRYVAVDKPAGVDENVPLDFQTPYGCSKGAADQYMLDYARVYGLRTVVFRHSTIYGGRQFATFDQGWVGWFCSQALATQHNPDREPFTIAGDGKQVRDLLFVDDAVECYLAAARRADQVAGEAFNIGGGMDNSSSLLELFEQLESFVGVKLRYERQAWRHSDQRFFVADIGKAQRLLGWSPRVTKQEGVRRMLEWCASKPSVNCV